MCQRVNTCDPLIDVQSCLRFCTENPGSIRSLRDDVVDLLSECMGRMSCTTVLGEDPSGPCFDQAEATVLPSAGAVDYCKAVSKSDFECGYVYHPSECADNVKLWDDGFLVGNLRCTEETTCDAYEECFVRAWDGA